MSLPAAFPAQPGDPWGGHNTAEIAAVYREDAKRGSTTTTRATTEPVTTGSPDTDPLANVRNGLWLDAQTFQPLQYAVPGIVPEGFGLLVGPPKAGKSWAALAIGLAVASGGIALGSIPVGRPRPVLYLALEDGDRRLQDRCRMLLDDRPIPARLDYVTRSDWRSAMKLIKAWLERNSGRNSGPGPLVLIDTLGKVSPPPSPGESAYARDYRIGGSFKAIADDHPGASVIAVHHDRKASSDDFVDAASGTHGLAGSADFVIVLDRKRQESEGVLKVTGRDVMEAEYAVRLDNHGLWTLVGASVAAAAAQAIVVKSTAGVGEVQAEIIRFVAGRPNGTSPKDVATALSIDSDQACTYLTRAVNTGRIDKAGRGIYMPLEC